MEYIKYVDVNLRELEETVDKLTFCPYTYSNEWHEFQKEYMKPFFVADESFLLVQDNTLLAIVKVFVEEDVEGEKYIGWDRGFLEAPYVNPELSVSRQEKVLKAIMNRIDEIAMQYECKRTMFKFEVLANPNWNNYSYNYNWLTRFGYLDFTSASQIIDLSLEETELRQKFRKGTKSEIKRGKTLNIVIKDYKNIKKQDIDQCKEIYEYDAGKTTRTSEMLEYYYDLVARNMGLLEFAELNGKRVAVMISVYYHQLAYYLLYAEKTDQADKTSPGYLLQYTMITELKNRGVLYYDMGEQVYGKSHYSNPSLKEINISLYKRGFGGYTVPMFRGIKEYERV